MKKVILTFICILFLLWVAYIYQNNISINNVDRDIIKKPEKSININYSIWTTYWDTSNLESELEQMKDSIKDICYFAAYFNYEKRVFIPKETIESFEKVKATYGPTTYGSYLSFVNDLILEDNSSSLKDVGLLYSLFETEDSMNRHIKDILNMTVEEGFDGIEIDYEAINKDIKLWGLFSMFVEKLYESANERNIPLRIVLEPNAPLDRINLPKGPEYVIMCYNLHGYGTSAGPKANKVFIEEMIKKAEYLPGRVSFAFATGGYNFQSNGIVSSLTEKEAVELLSIYNESPVRDEKSHAQFFSYIDYEGVKHEVWYADKDTIQYWIQIVKESGDYDISLWRLGGNITLCDSLQLKR